MSSDDTEFTSDENAVIYPMRLQKFLARSGVASRRGSENLMTAGRVRVNGIVVKQLGSKVDPTCDVVEVDGVEVHLQDGSVYLMLNKPAGYLTTMADPQGRACVAHLVPTSTYPGLYPVGRLDKNTTGLLLFTTNGEIGNSLLHPSNHVTKTYIARVSGIPTSEELSLLREGVELEDGCTAPAEVEIMKTDSDCSFLSLSIHEGRYRQVRRMCSAIHHECLELQRISFGPLSLGNLEEGAWRMLSQKEEEAIKLAARKEC